MKIFFTCLCTLIHMACFGAINPAEFQKFIKEYSNSYEKNSLGWSEIVYAIEKDYNDDMIIFCNSKFRIYETIYKSNIIKMD